MNNDYKSQMQNIKFSPDFNERTIKLLQDYKNGVDTPLSLEIKTEKEHPKIITVIKAVSLSLAACLLCVFTVTLIMEQNKTESIPEVSNIKYTYDVSITETEPEIIPEIIENIEEYTPFAAPDIVDPAAGEEPFNISPPVAPETTVAEPPVTTVIQESDIKVTEPSVTIVTTLKPIEDTKEDISAGDSEEDAVEEDSAEDADVVYDDSEVADDAMLYESEEDAAVESADDEMVLIDEENILTTNIVAVKPNHLTAEKYISSIKSIKSATGSLTYNGDLQGEIAPSDTLKLMTNTATPFASNTDSDMVTLLKDNLEFVLTFSGNDNINYTICLYSDTIAIMIKDNGKSEVTAVVLDSDEHDELFKNMYILLFSQSEYELYVAEKTGK
jgi:hypothetical protein